MIKKVEAVLLLSFILSAFPVNVFAKVSINEVAWMGNDKSQYGEWVELYNDSTDSVDLSGAGLYEGGGKTLIIKLTKSIAPLGYYLIARSTPSMPDPVSGLADDLASFGGSGLSNSGEFLMLKSALGDILDSIDASAGWPAGDSSTKLTMQKSGDSWITATGTPRSLNASSQNSNTNSTNATSSISNNQTSIIVDPLDDVSSTLSVHSSQADLSNKSGEVKIFASAGRNRLALVDTPVAFEERLFNSKSEDLDGGDVKWSFGDGQSGTGKLIVHSYKFPGDYAVVMNVLKNAENYVARTNVRIVPANLSILEVVSDHVTVKNRSTYEANLGGWKLTSGRSSFVFPADTIIMQGGQMIISAETLGFDPMQDKIEICSFTKCVATYQKVKIDSVIRYQSAVATSTENSASTTALLNETEHKLLQARQNLANISHAPKKVLVQADILPVVPQNENKNLESSQFSTTTQVAIKPSSSLIQILLELPVNSYRYLKSFLF